MNTCTSAAVSMCTSAAVLNSCNAAASASRRTRRTRADDREYNYDLFYSLLEEGRGNPPRPGLAAADAAAAGDGCREAEEPAGCCPAWKIAIRSLVVVASLLAAAFLVSLVPTCESWSDAFPLVGFLVMLVLTGGTMWAATLDCAIDPAEYHRKRRMRAQVDM